MRTYTTAELLELGRVSRSVPAQEELPKPRMSRRERLLRWSELLDNQEGPGAGRVATFRGIEYLELRTVSESRVDGSALSVAAADPVFRAQGLLGDRLGDGMRFFELTRGEAHKVLCYCNFHGHSTTSVEATRAALHRIADSRFSNIRAQFRRLLRWVRTG